jgi:hypothetical protein
VSYGEVLGDKRTMRIRVTVLFITFFQYSSDFILYNFIYGCMFCMLLFNFVNYVFLLLCYTYYVMYFYYYVMCSLVSLSILIVMYVPFCVLSHCVVLCTVCVCVLDYCHRVSTRVQLNIYHIIYLWQQPK